MCDISILENGGTLKLIPDCSKIQKTCNKAVHNYPNAFVLECYKTQDLCDKTNDTFFSIKKFVPECHKTLEMCNKAVNRCIWFYFWLI